MIMNSGANPRTPELSLTIPCYNEEACIGETIPPLVEEFQRRNIDLELVLVDNGSTDRTGAIIDEFLTRGMPIVKVELQHNVGYSTGVMEGLSRCRAPIVGYLHADGQVDPSDIVLTYRLLEGKEQRTLAKVRRRFRGDSGLRKVVSTIYNLLMQVVFGRLGSIDINGCPKMFSRHNFELFQCRSEDWFLDPEIVLKAKRLGLRIIEVDVEGRFRHGGKSHVRPSAIIEFFKNIWVYRTSSYLREWRKSIEPQRFTPPNNDQEMEQAVSTKAREVNDEPMSRVRIVETSHLEDERGFLHKVLTNNQRGGGPWEGETYVVAALPNEVRGNHYHRKMGEWFSVILGKGSLELLDPANGSTQSIALDLHQPCTIYVPAGIAHALVNRGEEMMVVVACAECDYDPEDVYPMTLWPPVAAQSQDPG